MGLANINLEITIVRLRKALIERSNYSLIIKYMKVRGNAIILHAISHIERIGNKKVAAKKNCIFIHNHCIKGSAHLYMCLCFTFL